VETPDQLAHEAPSFPVPADSCLSHKQWQELAMLRHFIRWRSPKPSSNYATAPVSAETRLVYQDFAVPSWPNSSTPLPPSNYAPGHKKWRNTKHVIHVGINGPQNSGSQCLDTAHSLLYMHFLCRQHRSFHIDWEMVTFGFEIRKNL